MSRIKIGRATPKDMANMLAAISTSTSPKIFADCDVVIEAVTENEALKKEVYKALAQVIRPDAILASNTSTISITRMAESAPNAEQFIGMHFFSPVDRMELVEIIRGAKTSDETVATIVALAKKIRKTPIVVNDCPGFLVNRVLFPYMNESLILLHEGVAMDAIDRAATRFGMPMGPLALDRHGRASDRVFCRQGAGACLSRSGGDLADPRGDAQGGPLGEKSPVQKFWISDGKRSKPQANPAVLAIIAKHKTGEHIPVRRRDHRPVVPAHAARGDPGARGGDRPRAGRRRHGADPGDRLPAVPRGNPPLVRQPGSRAVVERLARYAPLGKRFEPTETLVRHGTEGRVVLSSPEARGGMNS